MFLEKQKTPYGRLIKTIQTGLKKREKHLSNAARMSIEQRLGAELSARREEAGMSKYRLCRETGVHYGYISALEKGERSMSVAMLARLCDALDLEICLAPKNSAPNSGGE